VTIHLDTSVLIDVFTAGRPLLGRYEAATIEGHLLITSSPVIYEWLRGPRLESELDLQRRLCPDPIVFGAAEAAAAAAIYKKLTRARGREMDVAIAACAIEHGAALWTVNARDFSDIPGLRLYEDHR
jgi:predicted nucleic acid-binding protein